jgi:tetratricopeptide (TPR) repeat protein
VVLAARAWAADDLVAARQHFEEGTRAYNLGEFKRAADEYREAYHLSADPALLYNIAQAYRLDKNAEQALFFYRSYLRNSPNSSHQQEVEQRIRILEEQLKQQQAPPNEIVRPTAPAQVESSPTQALVATPPPRRPAYKKWWLWTGVGVVVVGVGLGVGLGLGLKPGVPHTQLGNLKAF